MGGAWVKRIIAGTGAAVVLAVVLGAPAASAEALSPWWGVTSGSQPTNLVTGETGRIVVTTENRGDASTSGVVTISDVLPAGLEATGIEGVAGELSHRGPVSCALQTLTCTFSGSLHPYEEIEIGISVSVQGAFSGEQNTASVSGGAAASSASASHQIEVDGSEHFGVEDFQLIAEDPGGSVDTQAGSHPFQLTSVVTLNTKAPEPGGGPRTVALPKDILSELPAGLVADPAGLARCTEAQFNAQAEGHNACPSQTAVGVATLTFNEPSFPLGRETITTPISNMTPLPGEPARFGVDPLGRLPVFLETAIRSGGDYGVTLTASNITQEAWLLSLKLTFWGVPGDARHDDQRGWECLEGFGTCTPSTATNPPPFLSLPSTCVSPLQSSVQADSWAAPGQFETFVPSEPLQALDGCNQISFSPTISAEPSTDSASAPSGFDFDLDFNDEGLSSHEGIVESQLKEAVVTLPAGMTIDPSVGVGLGGCTAADYASETLQSAPGAGCPNDSKVGTVEIETPLVTQQIDGSIFIAQPYENPFSEARHPTGSLLAIYIVAKNPETGIMVKLAGRVEAGGQEGVAGLQPGQLRIVLEKDPQLALDHFNLDFREGPQALLISPPACGTYTTRAQLTPFSEPTTALTDTSSFTITSGAGGGACPSGGGVPPFNPQIEAGTLNENAGAASPFYLRLTRTDSDQEISSFSASLPPGLTAVLAGIPFCPEADIALARTKSAAQEEAEPSCPAASEIGHTLIGTGVGAVLDYLPGKIYLAGAYNGDPFSIVDVTSAKLGPLDLGTIVLRFGLKIDPATADVSFEPTASEPIPEIIDGIVTHVRDIRVYIERPDGAGGAPFILNPTSCAPMAISSTLTSNLGQSATVSSRFQAASCKSLKFQPKLAASTEAHAEALKDGAGASLNVKIASKAGPRAGGEEANTKRIDLTLPKLLPARLQPTLQNACTGAQFAKDPAGCPPDSFVGTATALTPILDMGLTGPAIFVSHGGAALPDLDLVLQGEGVEILLTGHTNIKGEVTYAKFETVPDAPISSFELTLPEGPHSALASGLPTKDKSLCGQSLEMGTTLEGQNGAVVKQDIRVKIEGCKPALYIRSTKVSGKSVTLTVTVPSAGKIVASGAGLSRQTKHPAGEKLVTLKLTLTRALAVELSTQHKLKTKVKLAFTPKRGKKLTKTVAVTFK